MNCPSSLVSEPTVLYFSLRAITTVSCSMYSGGGGQTDKPSSFECTAPINHCDNCSLTSFCLKFPVITLIPHCFSPVCYSLLASPRIQTSLLCISYDDLPLWCWHYSFLFSSAVMNIFLWSYQRQSGRECVFIPLFCSYFWITHIACNNAANICNEWNNFPADQLLYSCCVVSKRNFNFLICSSFPLVLSFFFFFLAVSPYFCSV